MSRVSRTFRWTGRIVKFLFFCIIFGVISLLVWRMASSGDPDSMHLPAVNDKLAAAYEQAGGELYLFRQEQNSITRAESNAGYFSVTDALFIPEANQVQIVVRYNNSTIRALCEDYGLAETPDRSAELYDVTLLIATDLTPDNDADNSGNDPASVAFTRIRPTSVEKDQKNLYNYRRLVFDLDSAGLSLAELLESGEWLAAYADFYYVEDIDYEATPYGTLCLYDFQSERDRAKLDKEDRQAIEAHLGGE